VRNRSQNWLGNGLHFVGTNSARWEQSTCQFEYVAAGRRMAANDTDDTLAAQKYRPLTLDAVWAFMTLNNRTVKFDFSRRDFYPKAIK